MKMFIQIAVTSTDTEEKKPTADFPRRWVAAEIQKHGRINVLSNLFADYTLLTHSANLGQLREKGEQQPP
jgi:hypothetical protein